MNPRILSPFATVRANVFFEASIATWTPRFDTGEPPQTRSDSFARGLFSEARNRTERTTPRTSLPGQNAPITWGEPSDHHAVINGLPSILNHPCGAFSNG